MIENDRIEFSPLAANDASRRIFTYEELSEDQKRVHDKALHNIRNGIDTTITGGPGVGKTTLVQVLFKTLRAEGREGIRLTAPTHQAKNVLSAAVGMDAETIHSALKISPVTNEELRVFEQQKGKRAADLSECTLFTIDEVSMVDNAMRKIVKKTLPGRATVLGLGDIDQIRPVSEDENGQSQLSPFFDTDMFDVLRMDQIMRQAEGNPIIRASRSIRDGNMIAHDFDESTQLGLRKHGSIKDLLVQFFRAVRKPDDLIENRMLAYTNVNVDKLNATIRKHLYKTTKPVILGEVVVMQEPLVQESTFGGVKYTEVLYNNNERVVVLDIQPRIDPLSAKGCDQKSEIEYLRLKTQSFDEPDKEPEYINIVVDPVMQERLSDFLSYVAGTYKQQKIKTGYKQPWNAFWEIKNKFQNIKALPVCTYHKSQGSTFNNSYLYTPDALAFADAELCRQLLYVGVTRARNIAEFV